MHTFFGASPNWVASVSHCYSRIELLLLRGQNPPLSIAMATTGFAPTAFPTSIAQILRDTCRGCKWRAWLRRLRVFNGRQYDVGGQRQILTRHASPQRGPISLAAGQRSRNAPLSAPGRMPRAASPECGLLTGRRMDEPVARKPRMLDRGGLPPSTIPAYGRHEIAE